MSRLDTLSLRSRTTSTAVVLVSVLLGAGAWVLLTTLDRQLVAATDHASQTTAHDLVAMVQTDRLPDVLTQVGDDGVAQVFAADGAVLAASANITGRGPITQPAGPAARQRTFDGPDDQETETYRAWVVPGASPGGDVTVVVGSSLEAAHEASAAPAHAAAPRRAAGRAPARRRGVAAGRARPRPTRPHPCRGRRHRPPSSSTGGWS